MHLGKRAIPCALAVVVMTVCATARAEFRFTVTADPQAQTDAFGDVLDAVNSQVGGPGAFHVTCGDMAFRGTGIAPMRGVVDRKFGSDFPWYTPPGNNDLSQIDWLRDEYTNGNGVRTPLKDRTNQDGPAGTEETTYSWDYGNAHFISLNVYWDGTSDTGSSGDIGPDLYAWLAADLADNDKPATFVFGHEPAFPENRHVGDSLDQYPTNRDAFWQLLEDNGVTAYFCGHTHYYSKRLGDVDGEGSVWQINPAAAGFSSETADMFVNVTVGQTEVVVSAYDDEDGWHPHDSWSVGLSVDEPATVSGRHVFYNNSAFDTPPGFADADAIAPDKTALLPGEAATSANYTSFALGINGIIVDLDNTAVPQDVSETDFTFRVGNDNAPDTWPAAPAPLSVTMHEGGGPDDTDRVVIVWADHAIESQWVEVTVGATDATGLDAADVFYFGNAIGESGDSADHALVNAADVIAVCDHATSPTHQAGITTDYDFNRDGTVDAVDAIVARNHATSPLAALRLITVGSSPAPTPVPAPVPEPSTLTLLILAPLFLVRRLVAMPGFSGDFAPKR